MHVTFALVGEGSSDLNLARPLEELLFKFGVESVEARPIDLSMIPDKVGHRVEDKIKWVVDQETDIELLFVHRDADNEGYEKRVSEIVQGMQATGDYLRCIPVIPVKTLEAWALVDEQKIRWVADNPRGTVPLAMPKIADIESIADPKKLLFSLIENASQTSGRKLKKLKTRMGAKRSLLIENTDVFGKVAHLSAWQSLENYVEEFVNGETV